MLALPVEHLDSFTFRLSENILSNLDHLHIECLLEQVFGKMLKELFEKGKSNKLANSPRVRNVETKIFYKFGYFTMLYALILSNNRANQMQ